MQKLSKNLKVRLYSTFMLTGLAVILLTVAIFTGIDRVGYIKTSLIYSVVKALGFLTVAHAALTFFMTPKGELGGDAPLTLPVIFPSVFFALVLFAGGVIFLGCSVLGVSPIVNTFRGFTQAGTAILVFAAIFSFLAVAYFILNSFPQEGKPKQTHALIGFSLPVASLLWIAVSYFNMTVSMNTPIKNFTHLALISFMIWSGYELRTMLGKPMPRLYFCIGLIVIFFSGVSSLPWLICSLAGCLTAPAYPSYILYNLISLAIFAYSSVRVTVFVLARDLYERIADQTPPQEPEAVADEPAETSEPDEDEEN